MTDAAEKMGRPACGISQVLLRGYLVSMDEALFQNLRESIREVGEHLRGDRELPAEQIHFVGEPDPRQIRSALGVNQEVFAALLGISVRTLQNWEQGRRSPQGPALKLLQIAQKRPDVLLELAGRVDT